MSRFKEGFSFIWKIENFSMLPHQKGEKLLSPSFDVECLDNTKWHLCLYPKGTYESPNHIWLFLCRSDWSTNNTSSKLSFTLALESVNSVILTLCESGTITIADKGMGCKIFQELEVVHSNMKLYAPRDILTVRCFIWPAQDTPEIVTESTTLSNYFENRCSARTTIDVQRRVLTWPITKVSELDKIQDKISINLKNSLEDFPALKLSFYIDKTKNDEHALIEILQTRSTIKNQRLFAKCKITVVSADKKNQTSQECSHLFSSNLDETWHFPDFILIDHIGKEYVYVDDTMFLRCEFSFSRKRGVHHLELPIFIPDAFAEKERSELTELSKQIRSLFIREEFCDVGVRAGEQTFPCHKLVICAQSPVFRAMFKTDMKEKETGVVDITDVDTRTLEKMLNFLYVEVIEEGLSVEDICKLYSAADKYEVLLLQRRCALLLLSKLCVKSVCRILATADSHQDDFLLSAVYNYLNIYAREVFHSAQWKTFMVDNPTLSRETMIKIYMDE